MAAQLLPPPRKSQRANLLPHLRLKRLARNRQLRLLNHLLPSLPLRRRLPPRRRLASLLVRRRPWLTFLLLNQLPPRLSLLTRPPQNQLLLKRLLIRLASQSLLPRRIRQANRRRGKLWLPHQPPCLPGSEPLAQLPRGVPLGQAKLPMRLPQPAHRTSLQAKRKLRMPRRAQRAYGSKSRSRALRSQPPLHPLRRADVQPARLNK